MKKGIKKVLYVGLIIFLLMQLYQPARNQSYEQVNTANFTKVYQVPKNIETILRTSCYDCHSNNTNYPWYSYLQPTRFFMESHINKGKNNLNFDEYGNYSSRKQLTKLDRIVKQIKSSEMPLSSYTLIHRNAILTSTQKEEVINWVNSVKVNE
ncbi:heme-binding domain-containing protein [Flavobacterium cellulosilyticum]|uniref:Cytochrome C n=1 Tax=Flavobacterium cellulosilyticum TaxID=2541731 RepID=A0A4R5CFB3_9FLAO|nr:heme-binding domain-containing protein [Flavobacterium cellulosilyticum]TDD97080.1 cytochrome C [Flavobacterium cellulosilyticum]